jgi:predicted NAD/FAD-dependent oxidoreductase
MRIAILGAGLAGLACARALAAAGARVVLFDKGRAAGGRIATRRAEGVSFDHGAPVIVAQDPRFADSLRAAGVAPWPAGGGLVGVPTMSALPRAWAAGRDLRLSRQVVALRREAAGWVLLYYDAARLRPGLPAPQDPPQAEGPFDAVLSTLPAPQAAPLLAPHAPDLAAAAAAVPFVPCWTLMAAFPTRLPLPDTVLARGPITRALRDSAKPGRDGTAECWVVQAGAEWSRATLEQGAEEATRRLLEMLSAAAGPLPPPRYAAAHRWRYAFATRPLGRPCLWDAALGLGLAGDWCLGSGAEDAWTSGTSLAAALLAAPAHAA